MDKLTIVPYAKEYAPLWDRFVMERSVNGTFLQTRRFLSYHPDGRFRDASVLVFNGNELAAVCPAAGCVADGRRVLRSHPGSTFGGPVLSAALCRAQKLIALVGLLDECWSREYDAVELKPTSDLFSTLPSDALQYALYHEGYTEELELSAWLELNGASYDSLRAGYSFNKRYDLKKCEKAGLTCAPLCTEEELDAFYSLLCLNLQKFHARPVHTLEELFDFQTGRLREEIAFLGVWDAEGSMVAGACLFYFRQTDALHTQYLAARPASGGFSPSPFLYDGVVRYALERGCARLSFGTSTHDRGRVLNEGLIQNKEGYGAVHSVNRIFTKRFA